MIRYKLLETHVLTSAQEDSHFYHGVIFFGLNYEAARDLQINLPIATTLSGLKASSAKIYTLFGDLYDLPLFAYSDLSAKTGVYS